MAIKKIPMAFLAASLARRSLREVSRKLRERVVVKNSYSLGELIVFLFIGKCFATVLRCDHCEKKKRGLLEETIEQLIAMGRNCTRGAFVIG